MRRLILWAVAGLTESWGPGYDIGSGSYLDIPPHSLHKKIAMDAAGFIRAEQAVTIILNVVDSKK